MAFDCREIPIFIYGEDYKISGHFNIQVMDVVARISQVIKKLKSRLLPLFLWHIPCFREV